MAELPSGSPPAFVVRTLRSRRHAKFLDRMERDLPALEDRIDRLMHRYGL